MQYFFRAIQVLLKPQYRKFILIPLMANLVLFVLMAAALFQLLPGWVQWLVSWAPDWLPFLQWMLYGLAGVVFLLMYGLGFSAITNIFAAPFNGLLAEKIQRQKGVTIESPPVAALISRTLKRELKKLAYFIGLGSLVALLLFALSFIPFFNLLVPVLAFLWGAWCLAIQYLDYAADSAQMSFVQLRQQARVNLFTTMGFGAVAALLMMVPVVNIFVMPVAVAGGTLMWLDKIYEQKSYRLEQANLLKSFN